MQLHFIGIIIAVLELGEVICRSFTMDEGPFKLIVYNTSNCVKEQPWFHANVTVFNSETLRGTIVNQKEMKNVKFHLQAFYLEQGKIKVFEIKNQNCRNSFIQVVLKALGITYNSQKCSLQPMTTEFDNLNLNAVFHSLLQKTWYGTIVNRWEISMSKTTIMCLEIYSRIVKAKSVDNKEST